jgi:NADPH-dependent glutamate synthase beta subunit-like oxidoreductase
VDIKTNMKIGQDLALADLWGQGYSAILLATGAWKSAELSVPGVKLKGVVQALPLLQNAKIGEKPHLKGSVIVIGGGNVAVDAARTALRLGAEKVSLACLEERAGMPAFEWEIEKAEKEGVRIYPALAPQQFFSKLGKKVNRVDFRQVASMRRDSSGKVSWILEQGPDVDVSLTADTVIVAIGQVPNPDFVSGANTNDSGTFEIDPETMATNVPGLFAAGDAVKLPGTVVEAIAAGHRAGESIDRFLLGKPLKLKGKKKTEEAMTIEEEMIPPFLIKKDRWDMPTLSSKDAVRSFGETNLGYTAWQAVEEAKRCLNCRMCGNCLFDRGQLCFETSARLL